MSLMNLLAALTGQVDNKSAQAVGPDGLPVDPNASTEVEPLVVTATPRAPPAPDKEQVPGRVPYNYNNQPAVQAIEQANAANGPPRGGSANPGLYGLLPEKMQHGTLRNVLGAIGDAFLVQSGNAPTYRPRMERQEIGRALAGYNPDDPASVHAAIQRLAATGAPDSLELINTMYGNTNAYQQNVNTAERDAATAEHQQNTDHNNKVKLIPELAKRIEGLVANAETAEEYASVYARAEELAQRIGPEYSAADFGLVPPEQWTSEATEGFGMSADNVQESRDRAAARRTTERGQDLDYKGRIEAADRAPNPNETIMLQGLLQKQNSNIPLTPAEQQYWDAKTGGKGKRGRTPKAAADPAEKTKFENGKVYEDANGNKARYVNGEWKPV
jgi:hypothetical protein